MLHLCRVDQPFTWERDHITGDYIQYGEYYYYDDEDGLIVSRKTYVKFKEAKRKAEWDYSRLEQAQSEREYEDIMKQKTQEFLAETLMDRKVEGQY